MSKYPEWQGDWIYDFTKCEADQTVTLKYMTGTRKWVVNGYYNGTAAVANVIRVYVKLPGDLHGERTPTVWTMRCCSKIRATR